MCDMYGKRTEKFAGKLRLVADIKHKEGWSGESTARSWRICKRCLNKLTTIETTGDKIREEIELKLDELRVKHKEIKLLE